MTDTDPRPDLAVLKLTTAREREIARTALVYGWATNTDGTLHSHQLWDSMHVKAESFAARLFPEQPPRPPQKEKR